MCGFSPCDHKTSPSLHSVRQLLSFPNTSGGATSRLVYTYDASTRISHVWTETTQAQEKGTRACPCACVVTVHSWLNAVSRVRVNQLQSKAVGTEEVFLRAVDSKPDEIIVCIRVQCAVTELRSWTLPWRTAWAWWERVKPFGMRF